MNEKIQDVAAERDALRAKVESLEAQAENLRGQLAAAGANRPGRAAPAEHKFQLSEGDRQELEIYGVINVGGRTMTKSEVERAMADAGQRGVTIKDAPDATRIDVLPGGQRGEVYGVDYIWPAVNTREIDPKVAGTPGISGPAAGDRG